jgi:ligand-binding SRPBCC domain-containing protein
VHRNQIQFVPSPDNTCVRLEAVQFLPADRHRIFEFFADAFQLQTLTPPWLHFSVRSAAPIQIAAGTLIEYRLWLHGLPIRWQSRISVWEPPYRFVDEQIRGPYRRWRHEHVFDEMPGGTICRDLVDYAAPGGWLIDRLFVRTDLAKIFLFRQHKLNELFSMSDNRPAGNSAATVHTPPTEPS